MHMRILLFWHTHKLLPDRGSSCVRAYMCVHLHAYLASECLRIKCLCIANGIRKCARHFFLGSPACSCFLVFELCTCACIRMRVKQQRYQQCHWYLRSMRMHTHAHTMHLYASGINGRPTRKNIARAHSSRYAYALHILYYLLIC